jgi:hypothetical protein
MRRDKYMFRRKPNRRRIWGERLFWFLSFSGSALLIMFWLEAATTENVDDQTGTTNKVGSLAPIVVKTDRAG